MKKESEVLHLASENKALRKEISYLKTLLEEQTVELALIARQISENQKKWQQHTLLNKSLFSNPIGFIKHSIRTMHFIKALKDSELFDSRWYRDSYPDISSRKMFKVFPELHYIFHGGAELRSTSRLFNSKEYVTRYPDIEYSELPPLIHYLMHGQREGRRI